MSTPGTGHAAGRAIGAVIALLLICGAANAQTVTDRLPGTVTDSSNSSVPDAEVTATNQSTGITTTVTTDAQGNYGRITGISQPMREMQLGLKYVF